MPKNEILNELYTSRFMNDLIMTITSNHQLKDDLKQHLFLILCEMPAKRIEEAHKNHYLNYLCVNIIKKQYHSSTSPFHKLWRPNNNYIEGDIIDEAEPFNENMLSDILDIVNKINYVDRELFLMYYKLGRYDRWNGDLKDKDCEKPISSLRKIEKKLSIETIEGKRITISRDTIRLSLNKTLKKIKKELKKRDDYRDY